MTTIVFPCGRCGLKNEVDGALAGQQMACAHCGNLLTLPRPRAVATPVAPGPAPKPLSYKHTCIICGKRHQVPEALFGKRVACQGCGAAMDLPIPPGYTPRAAAKPASPSPAPAPKPKPKPPLLTFDEPPRAPFPPFQTFDEPPAARATTRPAPATAAPARPASPTAGAVPAILLDDDEEPIALDLDDEPAPPPPSRPAPAMRFAPAAGPPRAPAPSRPAPAPASAPAEDPLDVFGLEDDAPPAAGRRPKADEDEDEAAAPKPFARRAAFKPAKAPQKKKSSSAGRNRTVGFLGGGLGGFGFVIFFILRVALRLSPAILNQGDAEQSIRQFNQYWRDAAVLLRQVHDVPSAREVDPKVAAIIRQATELAEEKKSLKIPKAFKKQLDAKYRQESVDAGLQVGLEMRRIGLIPGTLDAMPEFKAEFEHFAQVSAELQQMENDQGGLP